MTEESQWTIETLREHVIALIGANDVRYNQRFEASQNAINTALAAQQKAMETALTSQKLAVDKAEIAAEKRFESVNEFRSVLTSQQSTLMPRPETMALLRALEEKLEAQRLSHEKNIDTVVHTISDLRLAMTHLLSIDSYETRHSELQRQVNDLRESRSENTGKSSGAHALWGYIVGAGGIALALIFHFVK
jgi:hypothetical protein